MTLEEIVQGMNEIRDRDACERVSGMLRAAHRSGYDSAVKALRELAAAVRGGKGKAKILEAAAKALEVVR